MNLQLTIHVLIYTIDTKTCGYEASFHFLCSRLWRRCQGRVNLQPRNDGVAWVTVDIAFRAVFPGGPLSPCRAPFGVRPAPVGTTRRPPALPVLLSA